MNLDINDDVFVYLIRNDTTSSISKESDVMIYEVYKVKTEDTPIINHYGNWFQDTETLQSPVKDKYERRQNLQACQYKIKLCSAESIRNILLGCSLRCDSKAQYASYWHNNRPRGLCYTQGRNLC